MRRPRPTSRASSPSPIAGASTYYQAFPAPIRAAGTNLPAVLGVPMVDGRWLNSADIDLHLHSVVLGEGIAHQYGYLPGEVRTVQLNGDELRGGGRARGRAARPDTGQRRLHHRVGRQERLGQQRPPNQLYIRAQTGTTQATANVIPTAISLGGPDQVSTQIPSDALQAQAQANKTLQEVALLAGLLALTVGGIGIANVMSISVIQRSSEIGIRRALGHNRAKIGLQFLLESLFVGLLGGFLGAVIGVGIVYAVSALANWVVVIDYGQIPLWMGLALLVAVVAGLYPSIKAARLEPLETLRLG